MLFLYETWWYWRAYNIYDKLHTVHATRHFFLFKGSFDFICENQSIQDLKPALSNLLAYENWC